MKKRILLLVLACLAVMLLMMTAAGADDPASKRVFDDEKILGDDEVQKLEDRIQGIREKYNFDIVIKTANIEGATEDMLRDISDDYYDSNINGPYHFGAKGFLIYLNLWEEDRVCWFNGCDGGDVIFDTYFRDYMRDKTKLVTYLKNHDWYNAFSEILDYAEIFIEHAEHDEPYSYNNPYKQPMSKKTFTFLSLIEAGIALLFGKGYASRLRSSMNTAIKRTEATEYINQDSFNVSNSQDLFMYSNVTRTPIPTETRSSSSGGSSIHTSSGGHSHSGSGIHF